MKLIALPLLMLLAIGCQGLQAQTNAVVFPRLLSCSNIVLMTDAEFRCTVGSKVFFQSGDDERGFEAETLDTNVLAKLGLSVDTLKEAQAKMDAQKHMAAAQYQQWLANQAKEQQAAAAQAAAAQAAATASATNANANANANKPGNHKGTGKHNRRLGE